STGALSNDLLREFHRGYPLDNLLPLLQNQNAELVTVGVWIASELGENGKGLLPAVSGLLRHPAKKVRFLAIDCMLTWCGSSEGAQLASTTRLLEDSEGAVRWKVMDFLTRAAPEQLEASLHDLAEKEPASLHVRGLHWLLSPEATDPKMIIAALRDTD